MRKFKLQVVENTSLEGQIFNCTVIREIEWKYGENGLLVEIDPPIPLNKWNNPALRDEILAKLKKFDAIAFYKHLDALFGDSGMNRAMLFPKWEEHSITPTLTTNPAYVYGLIPKGRLNWDFGDFHVAFWALILEDGPRTNDLFRWVKWD